MFEAMWLVTTSGTMWFMVENNDTLGDDACDIRFFL